MKAQVLSVKGEKLKEVELPSIFSEKIRDDILKRAFETEKIWQPYGSNPKAGRRHSASGIIRHLRHVWKSGYGQGRSRIPRKIMWRRGSQFYWIGAEVSSTRGGRRAHPPKVVGTLKIKRLNKKEFLKALKSAIASTTKINYVKERYPKLKEVKEINLPIIAESKITELKSKEFTDFVERSLGEAKDIAVINKKVRAGKGKSRNRKYKYSRGILVVIGKEEEMKIKSIENKKARELTISDLYPAGRLVIYTEGAIKDLETLK